MESASKQATKLAWAGDSENTITIYDISSKTKFRSFAGVTSAPAWGQSFTYVEHIPNSNYLISLHHYEDTCANFAVYEFSSEKSKQLFELGVVQGEVGQGDLAYHAKSNIAALIPDGEFIAYHLFDYTELKVLKKAKRPPLEASPINSFSFNDDGKHIAAMSKNSVLLISDVDSGAYSLTYAFHQEREFSGNLCRWNPLPMSNTIAVKYSFYLDFFEIEKQSVLFDINADTEIGRIAWHPEGNLIGYSFQKVISILDVREKKPIKIFDKLHSSTVGTLRWSPDGKLLASGSENGDMKVLDMSNESVCFETNNGDGFRAMGACFLQD